MNQPLALTEPCEGVVPLQARTESWMTAWTTSSRLPALVEEHGSPLNLHNGGPFRRNIKRLNAVASDRRLDFRVYFARKANKCLGFVDAARDLACGVDTASLEEVEQVLSRGVAPSRIICTAAIKEPTLFTRCAKEGVVVAIDNDDELQLFSQCANRAAGDIPVALRVSGFDYQGTKLASRFGFDIDQVVEAAASLSKRGKRTKLVGLHFHLDGYEAEHRIAALRQLMPLVDRLRHDGHPIEFIDMGGGFPMSYLESEEEWDAFTHAHRSALLGERTPVTFGNDGLGMIAANGEIHGKANVYPAYQKLIQESWLASILDSPADEGAVADALRSRLLELRCEPGRSILDGCGMTIARVAFRKTHTSGEHLVGLAMNRTQCRTSHAEFMVDPILIPAGPRGDTHQQGLEGYFVGAYCMESEFLFRRRMRFPEGVQVGDFVAIPNTAGYFMHFVESRSHQFPLAKNFFVREDDDVRPIPDPIDAQPLNSG